jgi:hypothetical protein
MTTAAELLRQGRRSEFWQRYCGFFDLSVQAFTAIQDRLLREQLQLLAESKLGRRIMGGEVPLTPKEFRRVAPITTYVDYLPYLSEKQEDWLPTKPVCWMRTSGFTGEYTDKWVPTSEAYYTHLCEGFITTLTLAGAASKGDVTLEEGDTLLYTTAPPPYLTGTGMRAVSKGFPFRIIPPIEEAEKMGFQERIQQGFARSMGSGIDYFIGVASVLLRIGESFTGSTRHLAFSPALLQPATLYQLTKALALSKLNKRDMLPKDIWRPKGIVASGMDVQVYKQRIKTLWGRNPLEIYACTEFGSIAYQPWGQKQPALTFVPHMAFWEFMPEAEYYRWREEPTYKPQLLLLDEIDIGNYVLVGTSFGGGAFVRYVVGDLIRIVALRDDELSINLPQMVVESRADDVINLSGMVVLTERSLWQAIGRLDLAAMNWTARKEFGLDHGAPTLHVYVEDENHDPARLSSDLDEALIETHEEYASFHSIMEINPIRVTLLAPGTYQRYFDEKQAEKVDLGHLKPPRMQPRDKVINRLLTISSDLNRKG